MATARGAKYLGGYVKIHSRHTSWATRPGPLIMRSDWPWPQWCHPARFDEAHRILFPLFLCVVDPQWVCSAMFRFPPPRHPGAPFPRTRFHDLGFARKLAARSLGFVCTCNKGRCSLQATAESDENHCSQRRQCHVCRRRIHLVSSHSNTSMLVEVVTIRVLSMRSYFSCFSSRVYRLVNKR
jgi:hypothetical protein